MQQVMQEQETMPREPAAWFCVRAQPKHEHIAAAQLRQDPNILVFLPRIRYRRSTRCGLAWVTEALFPNYLFARFDLASQLRLVQSVRGVRGVVHFGARWPTIPDAVIVELRSTIGAQDIRVIPQSIQPGDEVEVTHGIFHGFEALVTTVMPGRARVSVLLHLLGRQATVELDRDQLVRKGKIPAANLWPRVDSLDPGSVS